MSKDESSKKTQTYYLKKANIEFLLIQADDETRKLPIGQRVSDDEILDRYLDHLRETKQHPPAPSKTIKKKAARADAPLAA